MHRGPQAIDRQLGELIALLDAFGEERWVMAFGRVREHVSVTIGSSDELSSARVVRDLLHMFRGGLGPFAGLALRRDDVTDDEATAKLAAIWAELTSEIEQQLSGGGAPSAP